MGSTLGVVRGVGTRANFGVAAGVETRTTDFGFRVAHATGCDAEHSIIVFNNALSKVTFGMAIDGSICSAYLVAVLGKDMDLQ